jgi:ribosomal protein S18 acetylase RimI-like enzyme
VPSPTLRVLEEDADEPDRPILADRAHLVSMWVSPEARRAGIGRALVGTVTAWAATRGARTVELWVTESNHQARTLYERCGFDYTGGRQPLPSDPTLDELQMRRPAART